jgi:uncharacterized damage-inducible protein DinB
MSESSTRGHALASRLDAAADLLFAEVASAPPEAISWKPAADVWSVMEILCHVAEFVPYWTSQALQVVRHPDARWGRTHTDTARIEAVNRAGNRSLDDVLSSIRTGAGSSAAILSGLTDAELGIEAMSHNPRWERKPASFIAEHLVVEHVEKHAGQVRRNVTQFHEQKGSR